LTQDLAPGFKLRAVPNFRELVEEGAGSDRFGKDPELPPQECPVDCPP